MEEKRFWYGYGRMMKLLEAMGLLLLVFGPIAGIVVFFVGGGMVVRLMGVFIIVMSAFLALYHFSFAYVMSALKQSCKQTEEEVQVAA